MNVYFILFYFNYLKFLLLSNILVFYVDKSQVYTQHAYMRPLGVGKWKPSSQKATDKLECVSNNSNVKFFRIDLQNSSQVRHHLRKDHGIEGGIPVIFSLEKPKAKLLPFRGPSGEEDNPSDYQVRMLASYFCSFKVLCLIT
ncbi:hypothetical protein ES332_D04G103900v1 [Gossypium tomentosum]|uniref:Uncharacterized protein n=1 Tax=Gossypium tomentosum TaxID=34277 RepID=A0A5D2LBI0_GOSTO|nr:hypothetical protein ES332_D04G103900v1 [Gossypium tomentosum]